MESNIKAIMEEIKKLRIEERKKYVSLFRPLRQIQKR